MIVLVLGAAAMTKSLRDGGLQLLGLGTLLAFIGIAMLSPLVSRPIAAGVGRLFSRRLPGRLGRENAVRNPRRTAATAAALMIGLALISAVTVLGSSLKASVAKTISGAVGADFVLNTQTAGFPDAALQEAAAQPGVKDVAGVKVDGMQLCDNAQLQPRQAGHRDGLSCLRSASLVKITPVAGSTTLKRQRPAGVRDGREERQAQAGRHGDGAVRAVRSGKADRRRHLQDQSAHRRLSRRRIASPRTSATNATWLGS